jgi:hypothetical protein
MAVCIQESLRDAQGETQRLNVALSAALSAADKSKILITA